MKKRQLKGLYVARVNLDEQPNIGVINKCLAQVKAFSSLGIKTDTVFLNNKGITLNHKLIYSPPFSIFSSSLSRIIFYLFFWFQIIKKSIRVKEYDLIYLRYELAHPMFIKWLNYVKKINPNCKVIIEIATFPYDKEAIGLSRKLQYKLDTLLRRRLIKYVDFIAHYGELKEIFGIPTICIRNGIDVEKRPAAKSERMQNNLRLMAIGHWNHWHGLDRLVEGIKEYNTGAKENRSKKITLHVVGEGTALGELKRITNEYDLTETILFHGVLTGKKLDVLFDQVDVGVGNLGFFRTGLNLAFPLKHREYCARGIPFILSTKDTDFPDNLFWVQYVDNMEERVAIEKVISFFENLPPPVKTSCEIRKYAELHLGWENQINHILSESGIIASTRPA